MTAHAPPTTDRRTAARFRPAFGTVCRLGPAWPRVGLVWDLSETGISMLIGDPPPAGAQLAAVLIPAGEGAALSVRLHVVHVREMSTGDYLLGAQFAQPFEPDDLLPFVEPPTRHRTPGH